MNLAERVLRVAEAAQLLGVSPRTYYQAAARGEVPAIRIGRRLVVPGAALARLLEGGGGGDPAREREDAARAGALTASR